MGARIGILVICKRVAAQLSCIVLPCDTGDIAQPQGECGVQILTLEHFAGRINETFTVDLGHGKSPFVLVEARPLPAATVPGMVRAPFSLLFHHSSAVLFPQRIYQMDGPGIGDFGIFLVPVARNQDGFIYQAVFN